MKRLTKTLLVLAAVGLTSASAVAGKRVSSPVTISTGQSLVVGSIGSTRNASGNQYLGCWAQMGDPDGGAPDSIFGGCDAQDSHATVSCIFPDGAMLYYLYQLSLMNSDSALLFSYEPVSSNCQSHLNRSQCCPSLTVVSSSYDEPKQ